MTILFTTSLILIGLTIGYTIAHKLIGLNKIIYHGPDSNEIKKKIFYYKKTKKYYKFIPKPFICPPIYSKHLKETS